MFKLTEYVHELNLSKTVQPHE